MRFIRQSHRLLILRNKGIERLENRNELFDKRFPLPEHHFPSLRHHLLPNQKQLLLDRKLTFQQRITLCQRFIISYQRIQIFFIILRNHHIHKTAAFLTPPCNQFGIGGRNHDQRQETDMVRKTTVLFLISLELLFRTALHPAINLLGSSVLCFIKALNDKEVLFMTNILRINRIAGTFAERQEIHRIQQVRFPHAVLAEKTIQFGGKINLHLFQILII